MPQWFIRGLRRGVVTTHYPARTDPSAATLPVPPSFRPAGLTRELADELVLLCPSRALTRTSYTLVFDVGACTACGRCQDRAPDAVVPGTEFELAATARTHLIKRIPLLGEAFQ